MSPLKRFIQKIAGVEFDVTMPIRLRAFGKLPSGTEFMHVDAGEATSRLFPDWIKAGHDSWIERTARERRGDIEPSRLLVTLPGLKNQVVFAHIWPSRDGASPPRTFPFVLFALLEDSALDDPRQIFAIGAQLWSHMEAAFWPIFDGDIALNSLRERTLTTDVGRRPNDQPLRSPSAADIAWIDWAQAVAEALGCARADHQAVAGRLQHVATLSKKDDRPLAVRLPMSPRFDLLAQAAAWLAWLQQRVLTRGSHVNLMFPKAGDHAMPYLTVIERAIVAGDFQALTTDAEHYDGIEPLDCRAITADPVDAPAGSLWDWANASGE